MNLKKVVAALSAVTMLGSMTVAVPASAAETFTKKTLSFGDITAYYYSYTDWAKANSGDSFQSVLTVGDQVNTAHSDYTYKLPKLMDGNYPETYSDGEWCYIGAAGTARRFIAVDLSERHKSINKIELKGVDQPVVVGLTNTISLTKGDRINLDYAQRVNSINSNCWNPNNLNITRTSEAGVGESSSPVNYTLSGAEIGNYRYVILHCNGSTARIAEMTLTYTEIPPSDAVASAEVDGETKYYTTLAEAYTAASSNTTIELFKDASIDRIVDSNKSFTVNGNGYSITASENVGLYIKDHAQVTFNNLTFNGSIKLETGTRAATTNRNAITLNNATVNGTITTDAYNSYPRTTASDINNNGIVIGGNSSVNSIGIGVVSENSTVVDTLDISGYTGSTPITVNVKSTACNPGVNFFTGSDYKIKLDDTTANSYVLSGTALAPKSSVGYYAFTGTTDKVLTKVVFVVTDNNYTTPGKYRSEIDLDTQITSGDVLLAIKITGLENGVTIDSVTLE